MLVTFYELLHLAIQEHPFIGRSKITVAMTLKFTLWVQSELFGFNCGCFMNRCSKGCQTATISVKDRLIVLKIAVSVKIDVFENVIWIVLFNAYILKYTPVLFTQYLNDIYGTLDQDQDNTLSLTWQWTILINWQSGGSDRLYRNELI